MNSRKRINATTLDQSALLEVHEMTSGADEGVLMRRLLGTIVQALVDAEATASSRAEPHQRSEDRTTQRELHRSATEAR